MGSRNHFHTYEIEMKDKKSFKRGDNAVVDEFTYIVNILKGNLIENLYGNTTGFVPYQFERGYSLDPTVDIEKNKVRDILVVKHYEKKEKPRKKIPENLKNDYESIVSSSDYSDDLKKWLKNILGDTYFVTFLQDFIFIPGERMKVIFPANDRDNTLTYQLNPYFEDYFEFNLDSKVRKITSDLLEWMVWKVKRHDGGFLSDHLQIEDIEMYDSSAHLNNGELKIELEGIEDNIYAMVSMISDERCKSISITLKYQGDKFKFILFPEGSYIPVWNSMLASYDENNSANRVLILEKISTEIIPQIYGHYLSKRKEWNDLKPQIEAEILSNVKEEFVEEGE